MTGTGGTQRKAATLDLPPEVGSRADISYWMGRVDGQLTHLIAEFSKLSDRLEKVEYRLNKLNEEGSIAYRHREGKNITFEWLVKEQILPIILIVIGTVVTYIITHSMFTQ